VVTGASWSPVVQIASGSPLPTTWRAITAALTCTPQVLAATFAATPMPTS
jgi:hypothetical protein